MCPSPPALEMPPHLQFQRPEGPAEIPPSHSLPRHSLCQVFPEGHPCFYFLNQSRFPCPPFTLTREPH